MYLYQGLSMQLWMFNSKYKQIDCSILKLRVEVRSHKEQNMNEQSNYIYKNDVTMICFLLD